MITYHFKVVLNAIAGTTFIMLAPSNNRSTIPTMSFIHWPGCFTTGTSNLSEKKNDLHVWKLKPYFAITN